MKSPFPGMDPFIEGCGLWEDFHNHLIERIGEALADAVPPSYFVTTGKRSYVVLEGAEEIDRHGFKPDVRIEHDRDRAASVAAVTALADPATEDAPFSVRAFIEEEFRERFIEIREGNHQGHLVTSIEVLSPSNKKPNSKGWKLFQRKRQALFAGHTANVIEIDLLRGGRRMPTVDRLPLSPYVILVARRQRMPYCQVWDAYFDRRLPKFPVPLRKPDPDVMIDVQPMVDAIYSRWRYGPQINYKTPLTPPFSAEDAAWFEAQLQATQSPPE